MFILKKLKNIIAAVLCTAMLSGCFGGGAPAGTSASVSSAETTAVSSAGNDASEETTLSVLSAAQSAGAAEQTSASAAALASENDTSPEKEERPLIIAVDSISKSYSPFDPEDSFTRLMNKLTGVTLCGRTRSGDTVTSGNSEKTESFGGKTYTYSAAADSVRSYKPESDTTTFTFRLRDDVRFADGELLTTDDVIFTLYLHLDPSYEGSLPLGDADIVGAINYRYDSAGADGVTKDRIDEVLASDEIKPLIKEKLMVPLLKEQFRNVRSLYNDSAYSFYTSKYPKPSELFTYFYSIDGQYSAKGKTDETVISEVADMYGSNYRLLASMTVGDETALDDQVLNLAVGYISGNSNGRAEHVNSVKGIVRNSSDSFTVTVNGNGEAFENILGELVIVPLHKFGDKALYRYENNSFGFVKGNTAAVVNRSHTESLGAGAFTFVSGSDDEVILTANPYYYKGIPGANSIKLICAEGSDPAELIADGTADICAETVITGGFGNIDDANTSIEKVYAAASLRTGYGYIGINADTVCIGDQFSDRSYALRKAIAVAVESFRDYSVNGYYGGQGVLTDYPFIDGVVIGKDTEGYTAPLARDADGNIICTPGMTEEERTDAVKWACLGYLIAAGYTVSDGKVTAAPSGGELEYEAVIVAGGVGDHPAYGALKKASDILGELGLKINIVDTDDASVLWEKINSGTNEIWAGAWNEEPLRSIYVKSCYGADSTKLKNFITKAEEASGPEKPAAYMKCYGKIVNEYAVEVPMYRHAVYTLFSTLRVDISSIPADMTESYGWADEIAAIRVK